MHLLNQPSQFAALKAAIKLALLLTFVLTVTAHAKPGWLEQETEHFTIIYRQPQAYLVPHLLRSAEGALARLATLFNYTPTEKIVLATFDFSDYGTAGATTVPQNYIRLEIEPFELGYENMPFHDRIQWLMNHELVHIFVNDQASKTEGLNRSLFSRVSPQQEQPLSVGFSLLTNHNRYTPRWHQEGIAAFLETWLSGGYGRVLASFDEMYFRSLLLEQKTFAMPADLEAKAEDESFLLGTLQYLYGTRFISYLAATYGVEKLLAWYQVQSGEFYQGYEKKFAKTFGVDLPTAWRDFIQTEKQFQLDNLKKLNAFPLTPITRLSDESLGWVTQPYVEASGHKVIFGHHQPHRLTAVNVLDLKTQTMATIGTLPTPTMLQIASTAYDSSLQLLFYTTNNNQLYRDVWVMNLAAKESRLLFKDVRVGQLTVAPATHELWGIRHAGGKAALVYSIYPSSKLIPVIEFEFGDELQHLAVSPSGRYLAATLHQPSGRQALIVADIELLKSKGRFLYQTINEEGSPEFPSWSPDEKNLYWNAYTNGVSNIFRCERGTSKIQALSHTLCGLFRPVYLSADSLFAFEFTSEGFVPVIVPNAPAMHLPAIEYFGQKVVERNPHVTEWAVQTTTEDDHDSNDGESYNGISHLAVQSLIPVVSGFQEQKVAGIYSHLADPLGVHNLTVEMGVSPLNHQASAPKFHFKGQYEYNHKYRLELEHNAASFYDLFNQRKAGLLGTKLTLGQTRYWKFDVPHKIKQTTALSLYKGIKAINDNLISVANPDFLVFETSVSSENVRRAIGSVDSEFGNKWEVALTALGMNSRVPQVGTGFHAKWSRFQTWAVPHNVLHVQLAGGYYRAQENFALGKFYLGGFGNQYLENKEVKQYREIFHFPGLPIYSLATQQFAKLMVENNLPPLRFNHIGTGQHGLKHLEASVFTQGLLTDSPHSPTYLNLGGQLNFVFQHWFNLESTFSVGAAQAWHAGGSSREGFISFKLLKN